MGRSCLRARACRPGRWAEAAPTTTVQVPATSCFPWPHRPQGQGPQCSACMSWAAGSESEVESDGEVESENGNGDGTATERRRCAVQRTHRQQHHASKGIYGVLDCIDLATRSSMCPKGFIHERCPGTRMHSTSASENDSTAATERRQRAIQRTHRLQHRVTRRDRGHCTDPATRSSMFEGIYMSAAPARECIVRAPARTIAQ